MALKISYSPLSGGIFIQMNGRPELVRPFGRTETMDFLRIAGECWGEYLPAVFTETGDWWDRREMRGIVAMFLGLPPEIATEDDLREGIRNYQEVA